MLADLRSPAVLVAVVVSFLLGIAARSLVQHWLIAAARPRWARRERLSFGRLLDPYGTSAALVGGIGWGPPLVPVWFGRRGNGRTAAVLLAGPITNLALGIGALIALQQTTDWRADFLHLDMLVDGVLRATFGGDYWQFALLTFGVVNLGLGILHLLPIPPLDLGRLLMAIAPPTPGWQRLAYHTLEESWGVVVLLVLGILPGPPSFLVRIVSAICDAIQSLIAG